MEIVYWLISSPWAMISRLLFLNPIYQLGGAK
jgi:hypothetical protein